MLKAPTNPTAAVISRRNPCFGAAAVVYLEKQAPELNCFLSDLRNQLIQILDPARTSENCPRRLEDLIKVKSLHAACFGNAPFLEKEAYGVFFKKTQQEKGFGGEAFLDTISRSLQTYLQEKAPFLVPMSLEYKKADGNIIARCRFVTSDTTVAIVLCTTATTDLEKIERIERLIPDEGKETPASLAFKALGPQAITTFSIISEFDKRTLTMNKHAQVYADVQKEHSGKIQNHFCS